MVFWRKTQEFTFALSPAAVGEAMYIEVHFQSASADGLRKFIESVKCPIDEVTPSFDSYHSTDNGPHVLRYITCCHDLNHLLKRKISALHTGVQYQEGSE